MHEAYFLGSWCLIWSEVLHLLVEVHAFVAFQNSTTVFICEIESKLRFKPYCSPDKCSVHYLQPFAVFRNSCNKVLCFLVLFISKCPIDRDRVAWTSDTWTRLIKLLKTPVHVHMGEVVNLVMLFNCVSDLLPDINYSSQSWQLGTLSSLFWGCLRIIISLIGFTPILMQEDISNCRRNRLSILLQNVYLNMFKKYGYPLNLFTKYCTWLTKVLKKTKS